MHEELTHLVETKRFKNHDIPSHGCEKTHFAGLVVCLDAITVAADVEDAVTVWQRFGTAEAMAGPLAKIWLLSLMALLLQIGVFTARFFGHNPD